MSDEKLRACELKTWTVAPDRELVRNRARAMAKGGASANQLHEIVEHFEICIGRRARAVSARNQDFNFPPSWQVSLRAGWPRNASTSPGGVSTAFQSCQNLTICAVSVPIRLSSGECRLNGAPLSPRKARVGGNYEHYRSGHEGQ
jgi:hypothetical protein